MCKTLFPLKSLVDADDWPFFGKMKLILPIFCPPVQKTFPRHCTTASIPMKVKRKKLMYTSCAETINWLVKSMLYFSASTCIMYRILSYCMSYMSSRLWYDKFVERIEQEKFTYLFSIFCVPKLSMRINKRNIVIFLFKVYIHDQLCRIILTVCCSTNILSSRSLHCQLIILSLLYFLSPLCFNFLLFFMRDNVEV